MGEIKGKDLTSSRAMGLDRVFLNRALKNSLLLAKPKLIVA